MTKLSGRVALLDETGRPTGEVRDLGPVPIEVKPGRVLAIVDVKAELADGQKLGEPTMEIVKGKVRRSYPAITPLPGLQEQINALSARLSALEGKG